VVPSPDNIRRHFLPWDRPLLPQVVAFLAAKWKGEGALDLSTELVVVPTRQTGRRLREALAVHAAQYGSAVFPPRVLTPETLVQPGVDEGIATRMESLLAWTEVLRAAMQSEFATIFPVEPPARSFGWAWRLAQDLARLQAQLAEGGLMMADVSSRAGESFPERERWEQLAELERRHASRLRAAGRRDLQVSKIAVAAAPDPLAGIQRIVLAGSPDPLPLALQALAAHAVDLPVEVLIFAPETEAAAFDGWGRPRPEVWGERELELAEFEERVRLCANPMAQAEDLVALVRTYDEPESVLGLGLADAEVSAPLETQLRHAGLLAYNPEGRVRAGDGLHQLLTALSGFASSDTFAAVVMLARCPDFLTYLQARLGPEFSTAGFLRDLDELHTDHLPPDLTEARRHAPGNRGLAVMGELRAALRRQKFPVNVSEGLREIFATRRLQLARPEDAALAEAAEVWAEVGRQISEAVARFPNLHDADWWEVALRLYGETIRFADKPAGAIDLQGWLELLWEEAPHLVVAGMNDGAVPDAVVGDAFLPENLRVRLGLKNNDARFARDAYLLQALAACRHEGGRLDLLYGKTSAAGDPLRPSRLLLRCHDDELARRIRFLFREAPAQGSNPPWCRAWQLRPVRRPAPGKVAVTALRAWLECPFRFYLSRVLRMKAVDPAKTELDAMDFGTLCHTALEAMGRETALRDCTEPGQIREFLEATLEAEAARRFGPQLTLPLMVQMESARQRLARAAVVQAKIRAEGWIIADVERKFAIEIEGLIVSGKIDRIDRHEGSGMIRVLDYKTSDRPVSPSAAHLRSVRRCEENARAFAHYNPGGREMVWCDLQLPIYLRALAAELPGGVATCGYFNLPKATTDTGIAEWSDYTPEAAAAAWDCARGVAAAIRAGDFWPPNEGVRTLSDDFAALFHEGVAASTVWEEAT
jgi:ATP-dependent helicase/nuclease subunit B